MNCKEEYKRKLVSMKDAAKQIRSGDMVGIGLGFGSCAPEMFHTILDRADELQNVLINDCVQVQPTKLYDLEYMKALQGHIDYAPNFGMPLTRKILESRMPDYYGGQSHDLGDRYAMWSDVFIAQVRPPNEQGYINLGLTNFYTMDAIRLGRTRKKQRVTIGQINDQMPVVYGDNWLHISDFDFFYEHSSPVPKAMRATPGDREKKIGQYVLELIEDGDTIQMGIGQIPEAVVAGLDGKRDIGIHTEMFPIGLPGLVEKGIVTNECKPFHKGVTVATFCIGDQSMYDHVHENPKCQFYPVSYVNNPSLIAQFPKMVSMNMALMVDLSGQICSEGIGHRMVSGPGGQLDFQFGAYHSKGGKAITLMYASRTDKSGNLISSIVPELPLGSPVTVPRMYADYIVTEYGIANLKYKSRRQRAESLINIAHPDLRDVLRTSMKKNFYPNFSQ